MRNKITNLLVATGLLATLGISNPLSAHRSEAELGKMLKAPVLRNITTNKPLDLASYQGKKVVVAVFMQKNCSTTWKYYGKMGELIKNYKAKGVELIGVHSASGETDDMMLSDLQSKNLNIPLLDDKKGQSFMNLVGATCSPTFIVIDKEGKYRYFGSFDKYGSGPAYVTQALDQLLAGKPIKTAKTIPFG